MFLETSCGTLNGYMGYVAYGMDTMVERYITLLSDIHDTHMNCRSSISLFTLHWAGSPQSYKTRTICYYVHSVTGLQLSVCEYIAIKCNKNENEINVHASMSHIWMHYDISRTAWPSPTRIFLFKGTQMMYGSNHMALLQYGWVGDS